MHARPWKSQREGCFWEIIFVGEFLLASAGTWSEACETVFRKQPFLPERQGGQPGIKERETELWPCNWRGHRLMFTFHLSVLFSACWVTSLLSPCLVSLTFSPPYMCVCFCSNQRHLPQLFTVVTVLKFIFLKLSWVRFWVFSSLSVVCYLTCVVGFFFLFLAFGCLFVGGWGGVIIFKIWTLDLSCCI